MRRRARIHSRRVTYSSTMEVSFLFLPFSLFLQFRLVIRVPKLPPFSVYRGVLSPSERSVPRLACKMSRAHAPCLGVLFILPTSAIFAAASGCSSAASLLHVRHRKRARLSRMRYGGRSLSAGPDAGTGRAPLSGAFLRRSKHRCCEELRSNTNLCCHIVGYRELPYILHHLLESKHGVSTYPSLSVCVCFFCFWLLLSACCIYKRHIFVQLALASRSTSGLPTRFLAFATRFETLVYVRPIKVQSLLPVLLRAHALYAPARNSSTGKL